MHHLDLDDIQDAIGGSRFDQLRTIFAAKVSTDVYEKSLSDHYLSMCDEFHYECFVYSLIEDADNIGQGPGKTLDLILKFNEGKIIKEMLNSPEKRTAIKNFITGLKYESIVFFTDRFDIDMNHVFKSPKWAATSIFRALAVKAGDNIDYCNDLVGRVFKEFDSKRLKNVDAQDCPLNIIGSGSSTLKNIYESEIIWLASNGFKEDLLTHASNFKRGSWNREVALLDNHLKEIQKFVNRNGLSKFDYIEDYYEYFELDFDSYLKLYKDGYRFRGSYEHTQANRIWKSDSSTLIYAMFAQKTSSQYEYLDFETAYRECFEAEADLGLAKRYIFGECAADEISKIKVMVEKWDKSCRENLLSGQSEFVKTLLLTVPFSAVASVIVNNIKGSEITEVDGWSILAYSATTMATLFFTKEGRKAGAWAAGEAKKIYAWASEKFKNAVSYLNHPSDIPLLAKNAVNSIIPSVKLKRHKQIINEILTNTDNRSKTKIYFAQKTALRLNEQSRNYPG
jgi:hypothetical protein